VKLAALRGAITCAEDTKDEIDAQTARLVREMFERNDLADDDVVSIIFTVTPDLTAEFPASAARRALGLDAVALLGAQEQDVAGAIPRCIRVLLHCYTDRPRSELRHVFLDGASGLRADLADPR
jgi:chorismate mutase